MCKSHGSTFGVIPGLTACRHDRRDFGGFEGLGLGLRQARVTGRPAFWWESMNEVKASPASPLPECVSSCSLGNSSKGSYPSFNRRQRESSLSSLFLTRKVFMLLNDLSSLRHSIWSTSLHSSDDWLRSSCPRMRCSTTENRLWEMWDRKRELLEERKLQLFEARGCDPTKHPLPSQ